MSALPGAATYRGDHRHLVGELRGPTTYGAYVIAVAAVYDQRTDKTRVTYRLTTRQETLDGLRRLAPH